VTKCILLLIAKFHFANNVPSIRDTQMVCLKRFKGHETIHIRGHHCAGINRGRGFGYIELGMAPVATNSAPLPFEKLITGIALKARVKNEAPKSVPVVASDEVYTAGAQIYRNDCAVCHGLPGQDQTAIAKGSSPSRRNFSKARGSPMIRRRSHTGKWQTGSG